ncbi:MAG: phage head-tail joining protein [Allosphingosinicella sp.]|uniref:phage head-tail joining protein n=1 Tax=Allosphingosinicella sp. TaxID=2823234 RepID=UPI00392A520C
MPAPDYAAEIAALEQALASGELTVESDGERVTYRSRREIMDTLAYFRERAQDAMGVRRRGGSSVAVFERD